MAEIVLFNGTVIPLSRIGARESAVLLRDGKIAAVGADRAILSAAGRDARRIDLAGRAVIPGFNDDHIHMAGMGNHFNTPNLHGLTKAEILDYLAERYPEPRAADPIFGVQWDYTTCPDPHAQDLDRVFDSTPVILFQYSGHAMWANTAGLRLIGIDERTGDWPSGGAVRDSAGRLTGIVREPYGHQGFQKIFRRRQFDPKSIRQGIPTALALLRENGITSVQDNTWVRAGLSTYRTLHEAGELTCRVSCWSLGETPRPLRYLFEHGRFDPQWYAPGPRKYFLDGAFSSRTAYLVDPYADETDNCGKGRSPQEIEHLMADTARSKRQIACHSIGDRSTKQYCDGVERTIDRAPEVREMRWRIEHGQLIRAEDVERLRELGIVVSAQPHALTDPEKDRRLLGDTRAERAYPYRSLIDSGVHLAFGSDFPGEGTFNPLLGIHLTVNREGPEAITPEEALVCYTAGGAYAQFEEERKGTVEVGKYADLAVLSEDPTAVRRETIREIKVDMTIVGGRIVYERSAADSSDGAGSTASGKPISEIADRA